MIILIAGVVGLGVAGYGLVALCLDAVRTRQYADVAVAAAIVVIVIVVLVFWGDRFLR